MTSRRLLSASFILLFLAGCMGKDAIPPGQEEQVRQRMEEQQREFEQLQRERRDDTLRRY